MITEKMQEAASDLKQNGVRSIYVSVPISGDSDNFYKHKSLRIEEMLEDLGFVVLNPHKIALTVNIRVPQPTYSDYMAQDFWIMLTQADAVLLVDGWLESKGCKAEAFTAHVCQKIIIDEQLRQREQYKMFEVKFQLETA